MENVLFDEQTINANVQYALSVIAENIDKDGNLIVPEPASMDETTKLFAKMVGNPQKSFADIAKSPKAAMAMNSIIIQGVELFKNMQEQINIDDMPSEFVSEMKKLIADLETICHVQPLVQKSNPIKQNLSFQPTL